MLPASRHTARQAVPVAKSRCGSGRQILLHRCEASRAAATERPARGMSDFFVTGGFVCTVAACRKAVHSDTG